MGRTYTRAPNAATTSFSSSKNASKRPSAISERGDDPSRLDGQHRHWSKPLQQLSTVRGWVMPMKECPTIERCPVIRANRARAAQHIELQDLDEVSAALVLPGDQSRAQKTNEEDHPARPCIVAHPRRLVVPPPKSGSRDDPQASNSNNAAPAILQRFTRAVGDRPKRDA